MDKLINIFNKNFPEYDVRKQQEIAFKFIEDNIDKKHLIMELPTGAGKSIIGMIYGLSFNKQFFCCTPQKMLQDQYMNTINTDLIGSFFGRANYECEKSTPFEPINCEQGHIPGSECSNCPYKRARTKAMAKPAAILNTSLQFANTFTEQFQARRILVIDECHTLERVLCDYNKFTISKNRCKQIHVEYPDLKKGNVADLVEWLDNIYLPVVIAEKDRYYNDNDIIIDDVREGRYDGDPPVGHVKIYKHYERLEAHVINVLDRISSATDEDFVLCWTYTEMDLKYKRAYENFEMYINSQYDHILYMSATFGDLKGFARDLGITESYATLQVDPFFENKEGAFYFIPVARNTAKASDMDLARIFSNASDIVNQYSNDKGVIHCVNYKQRDIIVDVMDAMTDAKVFTHGSNDKREVLQDFINYKGHSIFVSPSSTEGLDLPDELCRFVLFTKVPWLSLGDQWVKERMKDGDWYFRQALVDVIQACGRGIRHENDWCDVYFLDGSFDRVIPKLPKWYVNQVKKGAGK